MTEQEEFEFRNRLEREQAQSNTSSIDQPKKDSNLGNNVALGAGALAGGAAVVGAGKWAVDPFIKKNSLYKNRVEPLRVSAGIEPGIPASDLPARIGDNISAIKTSNTARIAQYQQALAEHQTTTNANVIKPTVKTLSEGYPRWRSSAFSGYKSGLDNIENTLSKSDITFDPRSFNDNVIQKTADVMESRGLQKEAKNLRKYANTRSWGLDEDGAISGKPIKFSDAKQAVVKLAERNPEANILLRSNWADHLSNDPVISQTSIGEDLRKLDASYRPFKDIDKVVAPYMKGGTLDTTKATKVLTDFTLGKGNPETPNLLRALGSDTSIATPISGLNDHATALEHAAQSRAQMVNQNTQALVKHTNEVARLEAAQKEAGTLASLEKGLNKKIDTRIRIGKWGAGLAALGTGVRHFIPGVATGVIENELMNRSLGYDPAEVFQTWLKLKTLNPNNIYQAKQMDNIIDDLKRKTQESMGI